LLVLCGNHVSAGGAGHCFAFGTREVCLIIGPFSCLARAPALAHALETGDGERAPL
jgi:hypothetical protein